MIEVKGKPRRQRYMSSCCVYHTWSIVVPRSKRQASLSVMPSSGCLRRKRRSLHGIQHWIEQSLGQSGGGVVPHTSTAHLLGLRLNRRNPPGFVLASQKKSRGGSEQLRTRDGYSIRLCVK